MVWTGMRCKFLYSQPSDRVLPCSTVLHVVPGIADAMSSGILVRDSFAVDSLTAMYECFLISYTFNSTAVSCVFSLLLQYYYLAAVGKILHMSSLCAFWSTPQPYCITIMPSLCMTKSNNFGGNAFHLLQAFSSWTGTLHFSVTYHWSILRSIQLRWRYANVFVFDKSGKLSLFSWRRTCTFMF